MIQKLLSLLCLSVFLTACSSSSDDSAAGSPPASNSPPTEYSDYSSFTEASTEVAKATVTEDVTLLFSGTAVGETGISTYTRTDKTKPFYSYDGDTFKLSDGVTVSGAGYEVPTIAAPGLAITLNKDDGTIAGAVLTANGNTYTMDIAAGETASKVEARGKIMEAKTELKASSTLFVTRELDTGSSIDYNFDSQYMIGGYWSISTDSVDNSADNATDSVNTDAYNEGYFLVGFETAGADIVIEGDATFKGSGRGYYEDLSTGGLVGFDVTAMVDFATRKVDFSTNNSTDLTSNDSLSKLNIASTELLYSLGANNISGDATLKTGTGDKEVTMNGKVNARFYGLDGNAANELGGTFSLKGEKVEGNDYYDGYYYATFGATCDTTCVEVPVDTPAPAPGTGDGTGIPANDDLVYVAFPGANHGGYTSISLAKAGAVADDEDKELSFAGMAVGATFIDVKTLSTEGLDVDSTVTETTFTTPGVTLEFENFGDSLLKSVNLYVNKNYKGDAFGYYLNEDGIRTEDITGAKYDNEIEVDSTFGASSPVGDYVIGIDWWLETAVIASGEQAGTEAVERGYMVAGFETAGVTHADEINNATFTGKGQGYYKGSLSSNTGVEVTFDASAAVDFGANTVTFSTTGTEKDSESTVLFVAETAAKLDIDASVLTYTAADNTVTGTVMKTIATDVTIEGKADARFYGPAAEEIGGTFSLSNTDNTEYYLGYFGVAKSHKIID